MYRRVLKWATEREQPLSDFIAKLAVEKSHFENCWWPVGFEGEYSACSNGRMMVNRASSAEGLWRNMARDSPSMCGPVYFWDVWLPSWTATNNIHRHIQFDTACQYLPISGFSLPYLRSISQMHPHLFPGVPCHVPILDFADQEHLIPCGSELTRVVRDSRPQLNIPDEVKKTLEQFVLQAIADSKTFNAMWQDVLTTVSGARESSVDRDDMVAILQNLSLSGNSTMSSREVAADRLGDLLGELDSARSTVTSSSSSVSSASAQLSGEMHAMLHLPMPGERHVRHRKSGTGVSHHKVGSVSSVSASSYGRRLPTGVAWHEHNHMPFVDDRVSLFERRLIKTMYKHFVDSATLTARNLSPEKLAMAAVDRVWGARVATFRPLVIFLT